MDLRINPHDLNKCVQCGLCMPSCPTYRISGDETMSPRGRIALMRAVQDDSAPLEGDILASLNSCIQCRGCEPACPSAVPYGHMVEAARGTLAASGRITPWWQQIGFSVLRRPRILRAASRALAVGQRLRLVPSRLEIGVRLPLRPAPPLRFREVTQPDVYVFTGCVMDAWQRSVHQATIDVLEAAGFSVQPTGDRAPCCGALHTHAGLTTTAEDIARHTMASLSNTAGSGPPVLVNSAGCGAAMKEYGHLLGSESARHFSDRVFDIYQFLAAHPTRLPPGRRLPLSVAVQDPCHLRHVQRVHEATRTVLRPYVSELIELDDDGLCCGAGGAYSITQPELSFQVRASKTAAIERARADVTVSANPGCALHLAKAGVETCHPIELVARAIR